MKKKILILSIGVIGILLFVKFLIVLNRPLSTEELLELEMFGPEGPLTKDEIRSNNPEWSEEKLDSVYNDHVEKWKIEYKKIHNIEE